MRLSTTVAANPAVETDEFGIPIKPTWSVNELLSSYPTPSMTSVTFRRLHKLSALIPPAEGTPEHDDMKKELERLVQLVEAVKLIKLETQASDVIPDGRIWAEGRGLPLNEPVADVGGEGEQGDLLSLAARTSDRMYAVNYKVK